MNNKELFIKNKIEILTNRYKTLATLSILSIVTKDYDAIIEQFNQLDSIYNRIIHIVEETCREEYAQAIKEFDYNILPDYLKPIKTIEEYQNILALQYANMNIVVKKKNDCIKINKKSIEFDSDEELPYFNIIWMLMKDKKYVEIIKLCEILLEFSPSASIYNFLGNAYYKLGMYGKSLKALNRYVKMCSTDPETDKILKKVYKEMLK